MTARACTGRAKRGAGLLVFLFACVGTSCSSDSGENDGEYVECVHVTTDEVHRKDTDVLPVGRCRPAAECSLVLRKPCPCEVQVPRSFHACSCAGGQWSCNQTSIDAGICPVGTSTCHPGDSGTP